MRDEEVLALLALVKKRITSSQSKKLDSRISSVTEKLEDGLREVALSLASETANKISRDVPIALEDKINNIQWEVVLEEAGINSLIQSSLPTEEQLYSLTLQAYNDNVDVLKQAQVEYNQKALQADIDSVKAILELEDEDDSI